MKNKGIARRKIIELEIEIKVETIIKTGKTKIEILRKVIKKVQRTEYREKNNNNNNNNNKEMKKLIIEEINQEF